MTLTDGQSGARGTSNDDVRRLNLSTILELVHRSGGVSRSQLTRQTGLNRSTIAALVGELAELGLVVETEPSAHARVGRPSPVVTPSDRVIAISINPEIDAITVGVVGLGGRVLRSIRHDVTSVPTAADVVASCATIVTRLRAEFEPLHAIVGIGVAVPGLVSSLDGHVRLAPHLAWVDEPIAEMLAAATGLPVVAANDAHLGALAESIFGSGRGIADLVYLNGGASGIGGGVISGGRAIDGAAGFAGELGHTFVVSDGALCHCGAHGCLETQVGRASLLSAVGLTAAEADELETALVSSRSPEVAAEVRRQLGFLAIALRNAINVFNPEIVILGGFLGALHAAASDVLDDLVAGETLAGSRDVVRIERAQLGRLRLTIGAAELAFAALLSDPARATPVVTLHDPAESVGPG